MKFTDLVFNHEAHSFTGSVGIPDERAAELLSLIEAAREEANDVSELVEACLAFAGNIAEAIAIAFIAGRLVQGAKLDNRYLRRVTDHKSPFLHSAIGLTNEEEVEIRRFTEACIDNKLLRSQFMSMAVSTFPQPEMLAYCCYHFAKSIEDDTNETDA